MRKSVVKKKMKSTAKGALRAIKKLVPSKKAASKRKKTDAVMTAPVLKKAKPAPARKANPNEPIDRAHARGHRRLELQ